MRALRARAGGSEVRRVGSRMPSRCVICAIRGQGSELNHRVTECRYVVFKRAL